MSVRTLSLWIGAVGAIHFLTSFADFGEPQDQSGDQSSGVCSGCLLQNTHLLTLITGAAQGKAQGEGIDIIADEANFALFNGKCLFDEEDSECVDTRCLIVGTVSVVYETEAAVPETEGEYKYARGVSSSGLRWNMYDPEFEAPQPQPVEGEDGLFENENVTFAIPCSGSSQELMWSCGVDSDGDGKQGPAEAGGNTGDDADSFAYFMIGPAKCSVCSG